MKKAIISVKGTQKNDQNESDTIELITEGSFYIKGNTFYVVYEESELSGMDGTTTTLKITEDKVDSSVKSLLSLSRSINIK